MYTNGPKEGGIKWWMNRRTQALAGKWLFRQTSVWADRHTNRQQMLNDCVTYDLFEFEAKQYPLFFRYQLVNNRNEKECQKQRSSHQNWPASS